MKTATNLLLFFILILSTQTFSQVNNRVDSDKFFQERINSKPNSNEQVLGISESDSFNDKESRTMVNKTVIDNGFLLFYGLLYAARALYSCLPEINYHLQKQGLTQYSCSIFYKT